MNFAAKIILGIIGGVAIVCLLIWGFINFLFYFKQSHRVIASELSISTDWQEITPQPPLKAEKQVQYLNIVVDNYQRENLHPKKTELSDGTIIEPEVEIIDESGKVYRLRTSAHYQKAVSFTIEGGLSFPKDKSYTKVRIRSDKSFKASKVLWHCLYLK